MRYYCVHFSGHVLLSPRDLQVMWTVYNPSYLGEALYIIGSY